MMGMFVANKVVKLLIKKGHKINQAKALILGITFKEDCPDIRNSKVIDIYNELLQFGMTVDVYDPHAGKHEVKEEYGIDLVAGLNDKYDAIILAVSHNEFLTIDYKKLSNANNTVLFDTKSFLDRSIVDARL
jgi:UDP-N-acetyl-D-galactosamine dehydrogenase